MTTLANKIGPTAPGRISSPAKRDVQPVASAQRSSPRGQGSATCACGGGCPRCRPAGSPLALGAVDDRMEREADRTASRVMMSPQTPGLSPARTRPTVSAEASQSGRKSGTAIPSVVHDVLQMPGDPLTGNARSLMEPRFGRSFSDVRIHTDAKAAKSAQSLDASAYTTGRHIVFSDDQFEMETAAGRHLLAHELSHVAQHEAGAASEPSIIRRAPPKYPTHLLSLSEYEWTGTEQKKTNNQKKQSYILLSFDPATGDFVCKFQLKWRFPEIWAEPRRARYITDFASSVKGVWDNKFPLTRYEDGKATTDRAKVVIEFDSVRAPDMKAGGDETDYITWLGTPEGGAASFERWTMKVRDNSEFRDNVDTPNVNLDSNANNPETHRTSGYNDRTYTNEGAPPFQHYFDKGLTPSKGSAPGGTYVQTTSAHEFGHMIGLADEYVLSQEDYQNIVRAKGQNVADAELRKRSRASNRIENIGNQVTQDAYRPFADFLCTATGQDWRI